MVGRRRSSRAPVSVTRAVASFLVAGLVVFTVIGGLLAMAERRQAVAEAIRDARSLTSVEAYDVVGPALTDEALVPGPAFDALDRMVRERVLGAQIVRVKIWDRTGRVVYSDEPALVGRHFVLEDAESAAMGGNGRPVADVTGLNEPENLHERQFGKLLQVYLGLRTPTGTPLLFETYQRYGMISANSQRMWRGSLPVLAAGLVLLYLVQAPLAYRMARRLRASQEQREELLLSSLAASDQERRRIASDLHDGVVQGLAGASYTLSAASDRAQAAGSVELATATARIAVDLRRWVRELRSLVVTITPPALHEQGLLASLTDLAATLESRGVTVAVSVPDDVALTEATESMVYRVAQEGVRNIIRHARAGHVAIDMVQQGAELVFTVTDDGAGFEPGATGARSRGSVGLDLLTALVADQDGTLVIQSDLGRGTRLVLTLPNARDTVRT
jgi:two-component system NarL family sensor kinase